MGVTFHGRVLSNPPFPFLTRADIHIPSSSPSAHLLAEPAAVRRRPDNIALAVETLDQTIRFTSERQSARVKSWWCEAEDMSATKGDVLGRIDRSSTTLAIAVGDVVLIGLFVLAGELSHYTIAFLLANPGRITGTALPFYIGWVIAAPVLGAYSKSARETPLRAALIGGGAWIVAALIGQGLRSTAIFHGNFAITFMFVSIGVGLVLLVPWRTVLAVRLS